MPTDKQSPLSIEAVGLRNYLDNTMEGHNNEGYDTFINMINREQNVTSIAKQFGVDWRTARNWVELHKKERVDAR